MDNSRSLLIHKTIHSLIPKKQGFIHRLFVVDYPPIRYGWLGGFVIGCLT